MELITISLTLIEILVGINEKKEQVLSSSWVCKIQGFIYFNSQNRTIREIFSR